MSVFVSAVVGVMFVGVKDVGNITVGGNDILHELPSKATKHTR